jgi:hypothetical protein
MDSLRAATLNEFARAQATKPVSWRNLKFIINDYKTNRNINLFN